MQAWDIYRNEEAYNNGNNPFNTVFYDSDCDKDYVLDGLINHDGLSPDIFIVRA